ncbi:MAG TPA: acetylornithine transaminase [Myxococcales bacterium]|jgi:acetylornithine/N-succinyldiaminopimelate aminotransferase|nr:acetylornithine transaminase [Myxococcales bacterium]
MNNQELVQRAQAVLFQNYRTQPIALMRGEGTDVWDADGKKYLDFIGGIATVSVGHANPRVREALMAQAQLLWHASNLYVTEPQIRLAEKLTAKSKTLKRAFFCNSGTEANEALIKMARHFHVVNGQPERIEIICFTNSFHGRTMGSLAATGQPKYQQGFGPLPQGFRFLDYGDVAQLEKAVGPQTCAVFLEPVQGEAGVMTPPKGYLQKVRELCDKHGAVMLLDEVQTGMGRTGAYFAHQHDRLEPDAMSLAKGIAGGMPLGGVLATEKLAAVMTPGTHASTFGGNPLATAAACAVMEMLEGGLIEQVQRAGARLSERLSDLQRTNKRAAGERGQGLLRALLLTEDLGAKVVVRARELGLLVNAIGERTIRLAPPLTVSDAEIDRAAELLSEAVATA